MPADRIPPTRPEQLAEALRAGGSFGVGAAGAAPPPRPNAILYPAVLAIVLGAAGLFCCGAISGGQGLAMLAQADVAGPAAGGRLTADDLAVAKYSVAIGVVDLVNSAALVVAGVGAMGLRRWARALALAVSPLVIVAAVIRLVNEVRWLGPYKTEIGVRELVRQASIAATQRAATLLAATQAAATRAAEAATAAATQPTTAEIAERMRAATPYYATAMFLVQILVPLLILTLWTRPHVRDAFGRRPV